MQKDFSSVTAMPPFEVLNKITLLLVLSELVISNDHINYPLCIYVAKRFITNPLNYAPDATTTQSQTHDWNNASVLVVKIYIFFPQ